MPERLFKLIVGILNSLCGHAAVIAGKSVVPPQFHGGDTSIALTVPNNQIVQRICRFIQDTPKIIFGGKHRREQLNDSRQQHQKSDAPDGFCVRFQTEFLLKSGIERIHREIAHSICAKYDNQQHGAQIDCPPERQIQCCDLFSNGDLIFMQKIDYQHDDHADCHDPKIIRVKPKLHKGAVFQHGTIPAGEDGTKHRQAREQSVRPEEQLARDNDERHFDLLHHAPQNAIAVPMQKFCNTRRRRLPKIAQQDQNKIIQTEKQIVPSGAMPQSIADPDGKQRQKHLCHLSKMASEFFSGFFPDLFDRPRQ